MEKGLHRGPWACWEVSGNVSSECGKADFSLERLYRSVESGLNKQVVFSNRSHSGSLYTHLAITPSVNAFLSTSDACTPMIRIVHHHSNLKNGFKWDRFDPQGCRCTFLSFLFSPHPQPPHEAGQGSDGRMIKVRTEISCWSCSLQREMAHTSRQRRNRWCVTCTISLLKHLPSHRFSDLLTRRRGFELWLQEIEMGLLS